MIGGFDNTNYETSANTHIYDFDSETWSNGPALNQARKLLGCGSFSSAAHGGKTMVVVAGGYFLMDSVEFWDPTGEEGWIQGPALPEALFGGGSRWLLFDGFSRILGPYRRGRMDPRPC